MSRYNFGCGNSRLDGFINVDIRSDSAADVVAEAWQTDRFEPASAELVYARHMLEHLDPDDGRRTLAAWLALLQPGGVLNVIVPDVLFHARQLLGLAHGPFENQYDHACAGFWGWRDPARGGSREDAHRWGYTEESLTRELRHAGFEQVQRVSEGPDSEPWHLNLTCRKPLQPMRGSSLLRGAALCVPFAAALGCASQPTTVAPELTEHLAVFYDFEHAISGDAARERDLGTSGTNLHLLNGGPDMRVRDGAHAASTFALETRQIEPETPGNDDWKAGIYDPFGSGTMAAFASVTGITLMGWVKPTGQNPAPNSNSPDPGDTFNAAGLFGILAGGSDGHAVRALLEVIQVDGTLRLVALGRRIDGRSAMTLVADDNWRALLPDDTWTHLAAVFDYDAGTMALYRNGEPLAATYTTTEDVWQVAGGPEPDRTSPSAPAGIKIGGSFPQNTSERNPFNGRFDDLMFFSTALRETDIRRQYSAFTRP